MADGDIRDLRDIDSRISAVEAELAINQTITRYCRALDWLLESLLRTRYTTDAHQLRMLQGTRRRLLCCHSGD